LNVVGSFLAKSSGQRWLEAFAGGIRSGGFWCLLQSVGFFGLV